MQELKEKTENLNQDLQNKLREVSTLYAEVFASKDKVFSYEKDVETKIQSINQYLNESKTLPENVENAKKLLSDCQGITGTIADLLNHAIKRKSEVDEIYKSIYGQDVKSSEGHTEHTDGLKDELERSYQRVSENIKKIDDEIQKIISTSNEKHENALAEKKEEFDKITTTAQNEYSSIHEQLLSLLPGAMATGLSAAYESKKDDETTSLNKFENNFTNAIRLMMAISLIPLGVDIYLLGVQGKDLVHVIKDTPSLIIAILPLYFPVLWLAYSYNKKINLSKRLIEEYTHKSVLGKTFSGLSNQIDTLQQQESIKNDLRTRLLFNVLQVSAENPGKLITDYNKSDHPIMEALENSSKLSGSIDALTKIPGLSSLVKTLSEKNDEIFNKQAKKVEDGINANIKIEGKLTAEANTKSNEESTS
ncbi:hypothetical protein [Chromobacterium subtsugae]|uniref:hypothetical protein n=1 Tax=Chromobacterium subtsugae TaxID=251747 RepID=UPI000A4F8E82|nr:hypothetical protein [Chromobacterium subtsugae]